MSQSERRAAWRLGSYPPATLGTEGVHRMLHIPVTRAVPVLWSEALADSRLSLLGLEMSGDNQLWRGCSSSGDW